MTLRPPALGLAKPLVNRPFLSPTEASLVDSRPDGKVVIANEGLLSLQDGWVCGKFYGRPTPGGLRTEMPLAMGAALPGETSSGVSEAESPTLTAI
jgi:hypothetical protein